ncbi:MAG: iron ABC transporter permease [Anaerolineales bacterium]|nr:iron ABC transporter permease [Anaerolineales bacterium]
MSVIQDVYGRAKPAFGRITKPDWSLPQWSWGRSGLVLTAGFVAGLVLLVPFYLIVRTVGMGVDIDIVNVLLKARTLTVLGNTLLLAASVTLAATAVAVPLAWLTTCTDLPAKRLWAILAALPLVLPSYVAAFVFVSILTPKGLLQQTLYPLIGIERLPSLFGFPGAFLVLTLISYPYILLTVRAALQRMDPALNEAARSLGLSPWQAFWRLTLPYLRPAVVAGGLLVALYVLRDFGAVTMWQYSTFTRVIYNRYLGYKLDTAASLALVLVVVTAVILFYESRSRGRGRYNRLAVGAGRKRRSTQLGKWRWPALVFVGSIVLTSLIIPTAGLLYWFWRGWQQDFGVRVLGVPTSNVQSLTALLQPAWNSVSASFLAALFAMLLALPVAILVVRRPGKLSSLFERITYTSFALPGLVVALALVFFGTNVAGSLYQTLPLLLLAYAILFLPQAVSAQRTSFLQVSACLEEAGRSLGRTPLHIFRRITLPLIWPGVLAGGALVFLTCMKELPATLILSPIGFSTLSTQVWTNISEAFFARAAAPTLLLLLLSSLPLALLTLREEQH